MFLFFLSLLLTLATAPSASNFGGAALDKRNEETKVKVSYGAAVVSEGLEIEFVSVPDDSRCPKGVTCIWSGNAKVALAVKEQGEKSATVELNTDVEPKVASYRGYEIGLLDLSPYPAANQSIEKSCYVATLSVRKR